MPQQKKYPAECDKQDEEANKIPIMGGICKGSSSYQKLGLWVHGARNRPRSRFFEEMDTDQRLWVKMCVLLVWSALMVRALVLDVGADEVKTSDGANVVAYWERKLPGAIPSSIRAMVTPLSSQQATQLLINITAMTTYFPNHAAIFCKAARIKCVQDIDVPQQKDVKQPSPKNAIPFYQSDDPSSKNAIPFYQSSKNAIPFYQSDDPSSKNAIPFYQSDDPSSKNALPFYQSDDPSSKNALIYLLDDPSSKNALPFYQSDDPSSKNALPFYQSDDPSSKNLLQIDDPSSKNLLPFDHCNDPSITQNDASTKKSNKASSQTLDRISSKFTEVPRLLISPTVHEVRNAFREKQVLVTGKKIYIGLASDRRGATDERAFLPRKLARLFPFDNEGSRIESMLEVSKESLVETIRTCEAQSKNDYRHAEVKACLTSLEDVVDFVTTIMGSSKPIRVYDSLVNASSVKFVGKTFTVLNVETLNQDHHPDEPSVSCHDMDFPFRVFYCHYAKQTKSFVATLQAEDGSAHERIVNCHYDTSYWNPRHIAFRDLHTKPGEGEICHWLGRTWMEEDGWLFLHAI